MRHAVFHEAAVPLDLGGDGPASVDIGRLRALQAQADYRAFAPKLRFGFLAVVLVAAGAWAAVLAGAGLQARAEADAVALGAVPAKAAITTARARTGRELR